MIRINLIEDRRAKDKLLIQQQIFLAVIVLVVSILFCSAWWRSKAGAIEDTNKRIETSKVELNKQKKIRERVQKMEATEKRLASMLKTIEFLSAQKLAPVAYLDNLNVILPSEIWLERIYDKGGLITINGFSFSNNAVAELMRNMEASEYFARVELGEVTTQKVKDELIRRFKLSCMTKVAYKKAVEREKREAAMKKKKKKRGRR